MNAPESLAAEAVRAHLPRIIAERMPRIWVHSSLDSTNRLLGDAALEGAPSGCVCLAGTQTAGRGRRGGGWISPAGNLYLSLLWRFRTGTRSLKGLSLCAGVAAVRALKSCAIRDVGIKWPNDLYWHERKLAGILTEAGGEYAGDCFAVVGIGLNVRLDAVARKLIDQPVADLQDIAGARRVGRNALAGALIAELFSGLDRFAAHGFAACLEDYRQLDLLRGVRVSLIDGAKTVKGHGAGVDAEGAFRLTVGDDIQTFTSGEVSVRVL